MTTEACVRSKEPTKVADWAKDWTAWLDGDEIATSDWAVEGPDSALVMDSEAESTTSATIWLSGGTEGITYRVANTIVTTGGRTERAVLLMEIIKQ